MALGSHPGATLLLAGVVFATCPTLVSAGALPAGQIWFSRARPTGLTDGTTWVVDGDGQNETMVTTGEWPRLSPGGNHLLFHKDHETPGRADIYVRDLSAPSETEIFAAGGIFDVLFDWSNDGTQVFFDFNTSIFRMDADGTDIVAVIDNVNGFDDAPAVNRIDSRIVFQNQNLGLFRADADGMNRTQVPNTVPLDFWPDWSPDGQWISYGHLVPDDFAEPEDFLRIEAYYKIKPDGSGRTQLTFACPGGADVFGAGRAWTPDGQYLVVPATIGTVQGLYAVATDGSGTVLRIAANAASEAIDFVGSVTGAVTGVPVAVATCPPTPSPTSTAPTPTATATSTVTATVTASPTVTATPSEGPTPSATPTSVVTPSPIVTVAIDHFLGYKAKEVASEDKLPKDCTLALDDPLFDGAEHVTLSKVTALLLPADKNDEGVGDETTHLVAYKLKPAKQGIGAPVGAPGKEKFPKAAKHAKRTRVEITNQFGNLFLDTQKEELLLVPTQKDLAAPPVPDLAGSVVDHYKCYKVKPAKVTSAQAPSGTFPKGLQARAADQFMDGLLRQCAGGAPKNAGKSCKSEQSCGGADGGTSFCETVPHPLLGTARLYDLTKPVHLCLPVAKTAIDTVEVDGTGAARTTSCAAIVPAAIRHPETALLCYQAKAASKVLDTGVASRLGVAPGDKLAPKQSKHVKRAPFVLNQLPGPGRVQTLKERELCVPSTVLDAGTPR